jgi:hypothetical protein
VVRMKSNDTIVIALSAPCRAEGRLLSRPGGSTPNVVQVLGCRDAPPFLMLSAPPDDADGTAE